ncbi:MAG TPA: HIT domain-containing protein [Acidimicrobiia bacterium]|nr:HIT domain-containing protein [Acidimicrobiia bacterium]
MSLERLWAGWRATYIEGVANVAPPLDGCLFCALRDGTGDDDQVVARADHTFAVLNLYPYASGHLLVVPNRHVSDLEALTPDEASALMSMTQQATVSVKAAYHPDGVNLGVNLGRAAGAGVPGHLHVHVVPRWIGDTNFMTSVAEARVLPEALPRSFERLRAAWPT